MDELSPPIPCGSVTCVVSSLHGPMMVTHCIQVIQVVLRVAAHPIRSSPRRPVGRETPAALAPLHHVGRHVHACERELHHVLQLHSSIAVLNTVYFLRYLMISNLVFVFLFFYF